MHVVDNVANSRVSDDGTLPTLGPRMMLLPMLGIANNGSADNINKDDRAEEDRTADNALCGQWGRGLWDHR